MPADAEHIGCRGLRGPPGSLLETPGCAPDPDAVEGLTPPSKIPPMWSGVPQTEVGGLGGGSGERQPPGKGGEGRSNKAGRLGGRGPQGRGRGCGAPPGIGVRDLVSGSPGSFDLPPNTLACTDRTGPKLMGDRRSQSTRSPKTLAQALLPHLSRTLHGFGGGL